MRPAHSVWIVCYIGEHNGFVRGLCAEATRAMVAAFPGELRAAAGFVHWFVDGDLRRDQHHWCVDVESGEIVDPTALQFTFVERYEELDLDDPATRSKVPTGRCMNCGGDAYERERFCSERCEDEVLREFNGPA